MKVSMRYIGFYTSSPFWTIRKPEIDKLKKKPVLFYQEMSKTVLTYNGGNFKIEIARDGFIIIQIPKLEEERSKVKASLKSSVDEVISYNSDYLAHLNAFQFLLSSSAAIEQKTPHFDSTAFSIHDVFQVTKIKGGFSYYTPQSIIGNHFISGRKLTGYTSLDEISNDERIGRRMIIARKVFNKCNKSFDRILGEKDAYLIFSQINTSFGECKKLNFTQSLMISWFCIEYFINREWINYLAKCKKKAKQIERITGNRRNMLIGKEYTSSIISNFLELEGCIPFDIFSKINNVRSKRNKIVHNIDLVKNHANTLKDKPGENDSTQIKYVDCIQAFEVLKYFIKKEYKMKVRFSNTFTLKEI